jgi:hypothetical protein
MLLLTHPRKSVGEQRPETVNDMHLRNKRSERADRKGA